MIALSQYGGIAPDGTRNDSHALHYVRLKMNTRGWSK